MSEEVPVGDYTLPLGKARLVRAGSDVTLVGWGAQVLVLEQAAKVAAAWSPAVSCEVIDLRTLLPWDAATVAASVDKTGEHLDTAVSSGCRAKHAAPAHMPPDQPQRPKSSPQGRLIVSHEAPITGHFGAEIAARIAERCFLRLEAPPARVCGADTPFPMVGGWVGGWVGACGVEA
jgi:2-oxoisovalerate dehydrogenase E1 component beta subunit